MFLKKIIASLVLLVIVSISLADPSTTQEINDRFSKLFPDIIIKSVEKSPIPDFYQIQLDSGKIFYVSKDGKYLMQGYLFEVDGKEPKNLTLKSEEKFVADLVNNLDKSKMIIYPAKDNKPKTHITIFTDTSCPYCHKLHQGIPELVQAGIEVRYLAFPREGFASRGFDQLQSVWCADDKIDAMNQFMREIPVKSAKKCDNPIIEQYVLGQKIGVRATPTIVLENGRIIPGYMPIPELINTTVASSSSNHLSK